MCKVTITYIYIYSPRYIKETQLDHKLIAVYYIYRTQCTVDAGSKRFLENVYENEHRFIPGGSWETKNEITWTDIVCYSALPNDL